jgi:hypothetical protein
MKNSCLDCIFIKKSTLYPSMWLCRKIYAPPEGLYVDKFTLTCTEYMDIVKLRKLKLKKLNEKLL